MSKLLYLIKPRPDSYTHFDARLFDRLKLEPVVWSADLATTTVAALAPPALSVLICEEECQSVDLDIDADYVGIAGNLTQWGRMRQLAQEFHDRNRLVIIGGPYASLSPDVVRPHCDILVRGELEEIAGELFSDLVGGCWKEEYSGGQADLAHTVPPRWDLYPYERAAAGSVQTSRGCPFQCEFCEVSAYLGHGLRRKPAPMVLRELDNLTRLGYTDVFFADDNFTGDKSGVKELLEQVRAWNRGLPQGPVNLLTQLSLDAARDEELLELCASAGLTRAFVGIESVNEESLLEANKRQNLGRDLSDVLERFVTHGIALTGSVIAGFDHDGLDVFERLFAFCQGSPIPNYVVHALVAPRRSPLYQRVKREGRLTEQGDARPGVIWASNIRPARMTGEQRQLGIRWLVNNLFAPDNFAARTLRFIELYAAGEDQRTGRAGAVGGAQRKVAAQWGWLMVALQRLGPEEKRMYDAVLAAMRGKPGVKYHVINSLAEYLYSRHLYEAVGFWDQSLVGRSAPRD